ncbi:MAG TPA: hypothetical protein VGQ39_21675 [Pyrinomonadaceae bacterium]|jgi:hypothetical protein|nr:hypothetical protein [Pyrinomonadaceae bacterium]
MQVRFQPKAEVELVEARLWYSLQRQGLDIALMNRVETLRTIAAPEAYPVRVISRIAFSGQPRSTNSHEMTQKKPDGVLAPKNHLQISC